MSVELVSVEPVLTGTRPALRFVVTDGTGPATIMLEPKTSDMLILFLNRMANTPLRQS